MEWVRSSFRSFWRLYANRPDILTPGRFVFAPPGTPHLNRWHNLGSRDWTSDERIPWPELGEWQGRRTYDRGELDGVYPPGNPMGRNDCFRNGETLTAANDHIAPWDLRASGGAWWEEGGDWIQVNIEDSLNCGGSNDSIQTGTAVTDLLTSFPRDLELTLTGRVERENADFDFGTVYVDGNEVMQLHGQGDGLGCTMGDVSASVTVPLSPGLHRIELETDTIDERYHVGCFYRLTYTTSPAMPAPPATDRGFPLPCFVEPPPPVDVNSRAFKAGIARVLELHYANDPACATELQALTLSPATVNVVFNSASLTPGTLVQIADDRVYVLISGTSTFQQLALQAAEGLLPPTNVGPYGTLTFWEANKIQIHGRLFALGVPVDRPLFLAGHSYGGVLAMLLAATYRFGGVPRPIDLLTFGAPVPGDGRVKDLLATVTRDHLANRGDPIPLFPSILACGFEVLWFPIAAIADYWPRWIHPGQQRMILEGGTILDTDGLTVELTFLGDLVAQIAVGGTPPPIFTHGITIYKQRLNLTGS